MVSVAYLITGHEQTDLINMSLLFSFLLCILHFQKVFSELFFIADLFTLYIFLAD